MTLLELFTLFSALGAWIGVGFVYFRLRRKFNARLIDLESQQISDYQRFLRRFDHELKNPLTAIRFALANLSDSMQDDNQQKAIKSIEAQVIRISELLFNLRKLAELNQNAMENIPVYINQVMEEALALVQEQRPDHGRKISIKFGAGQTFLGDKYLMLLSVYNVIDNAFKFTQVGDRIDVRTFDEPDFVVIEVSDGGLGIPAEEMPYVWEELYRGQSVRHISGSGLGLALVKTVVEHHHGHVEIKSPSGLGTTVRLYLPTAHAQARKTITNPAMKVGAIF